MTALEWSPELPADWKVEQARRVLRRVKRPVRTDDQTVTAFRDGEVTLRSNRRTEGFTEAFAEFGYHGVREGDLAIHAMDGFAGAIGVSDSDGKVSPVVHLYDAGLGDARFFAYALREAARAGFVTSLAKGIRERSTSFDPQTLAAMDLPVPQPIMQRRIADYLDRETATIDALIDKQTAHVGLLRERRLAAQNRAVMGLDLDSDLIDGEQVPVGWTSGPIKRVLESLDSRRVPLNADERGARQGSFPYYGASGVIDSVDDYLFDGDLVLVGEDGANLLNRSTPLAFVAYGQYWVNNHAHVLRPKFGPVEFWAARIEALDVSPVVSGSAQPKLTADALMALRISWPENPDDMARIVEVMTRETAKIDALIAKAERFIELAQERRAALITAAVTGQIEIPTED